MKAPITPKPDRLHPTPGLTPPKATQYAGIAYITLAGSVDTMVPATGPWALVGQSASYLIKLTPLLWWALPSSQQSKLESEAKSPFPGTQYPGINQLSLDLIFSKRYIVDSELISYNQQAKHSLRHG
ncbi:hypothetical protein DSO57_1000725 [Entomophthora muscae]|uniref:Uncharacterized protein n=1 Tax=Entomophthora muscae TaxID=34485 RepID=A0ACC2SLY3_9FUNG|nr:hypothetical protein DSO57_1000725 [Entomophthora muscae]